MSEALVLVTGGSGFVGVHCIAQLIQAGYKVRTTVRSPKRADDVRAMLDAAGVAAGDALSFVTADLTADTGWSDAVAGCKYVLHVASPFFLQAPAHEDDLIIPARDGTLRVLRAARDAKVRRVVLTSSFVAIAYGHPPTNQPFTEETWTNPDGDVNAYMKSKTLAERAAWDFVAREGEGLELSVINPVGIFGPILGPDFSDTIQIIQGMLKGTYPAVPRITITMVDVRDVADLHLRAMTHPDANGQRFIASSNEPIALRELGGTLKALLGSAAKRAPTRTIPDFLVRLLGLFSATMRPIARKLGNHRLANNEKARRLLGWTPRSNEETILATATSLQTFGQL